MGGSIPQRSNYENPRASDPSAIGRAAAPYETVAQVADNSEGMLGRIKQADDETFLTEKKMDFERKALERYDQFKQERSGSPAGAAQAFDDELKTMSNDYSSGFQSDNQRTKWQLESQGFQDQVYKNSRAWEHEQQVVGFGQRIEKSVDDISTMAYRGDITMDDAKKKISGLVGAGSTFLSPGNLTEVGDKSLKSVSKSYIEGLARRDPIAAKQALDSREFDSALTPEGVESMINHIGTVENQATNMATVGQSIQDGTFISDLSNPTQTKAVNKYYSAAVKPDLMSGTPEGIDHFVSFTAQTGRLNPDAKATITDAIYSGNDTDRVAGYNTINSLRVRAPQVFNSSSGISDKMELEAMSYQRLADSGLPASQIMPILNSNYRTTDDVALKQRRTEANVKAKNLTAPSAGEFDDSTTVFSTPGYSDNSPYVESMYKGLFHDFYIQSGDESAAKEKAINTMRNQLGPSQATGKNVVMEYPPERYYSSRFDPSGKWIQQDLQDQVKESGHNFKMDDLVLTTDDLTREAVRKGVPPTYRVMYNKDGVTQDLGRVKFDSSKFDKQKVEEIAKGREQDINHEQNMLKFYEYLIENGDAPNQR